MTESEIATFVKKVLTAEWPDCTWQVLVGRNFGSCVQFEESRYIYFYVGQVRGVALFCTGALLLLAGLSPRGPTPRLSHTPLTPPPSLLSPSLFFFTHTHTLHRLVLWFSALIEDKKNINIIRLTLKKSF